MTRVILRVGIKLTIVALCAAGCSRDERLLQQAEKASDRQAEQNRQIARQNQELAQATNRLLSADSEARSAAMVQQSNLQTVQASVGQQRDQLESERRQLAQQRTRDPIIAALLLDLGLLVACLLPLVLCWYVLYAARHEPIDQALGECLAAELVSPEPLLLPFNRHYPELPRAPEHADGSEPPADRIVPDPANES